MSAMPAHWGTALLADLGAAGEQAVLTGPFGANLGKEDFVSSGVPVFTIGCLGADGIERSKLLHVSTQKADELKAYRLREGDFLFSRMASVGRAGFVPADLDGALFNYHLMRLRLNRNAIIPRLFYYYVRGSEAARQYLDAVSRGATRDGINTKLLCNMPVQVPPLAEQKRIVAKIESLSTNSKRSRQHVDHIPRLVEKYKQALLKAAFRGHLTNEWRGMQSGYLPVTPRSASGKNRNVTSEQEFAAPYELPDGWSWLRLAQIGQLDRGKSRHRPRNDPLLFGGLYPFIQTGDVRAAGRFVTTYSQTLNDFGLSQSRLWSKGTVCITIAANIAETAILAIEAAFPDSIVGFIADAERVLPSYVEFFMRTARDELAAFAPATAQKNINLEILSQVRLPIAPLEEQKEIVDYIVKAISWIDRLTSEGTSARRLIDHLDQAVLAKAFRGELVPQDPNDEPAGILLERIRADRVVGKSKKVSNRKTNT
jgi:type I restriction enzyme S subunit